MTLPTREQYFAHLAASRVSGTFANRSAVEDECPVCYEEVTTPVKTTCNHIFCEECLKHWLSSATTCPSCRTEQYQRDPAEIAQEQFDEMIREAREELGDDVSEEEILEEWAARIRHLRRIHSLTMPGDIPPASTIRSLLTEDEFFTQVADLVLARGESPELTQRIHPASPWPPLPAWVQEPEPTDPLARLRQQMSGVDPFEQYAQDTITNLFRNSDRFRPSAAEEQRRVHQGPWPAPSPSVQPMGHVGRGSQAGDGGRGHRFDAPTAIRDYLQQQQQARPAPQQAPPRNNEPLQRAQQADRGRNVFNVGPPVPAAQRRNPLNMVPRRQQRGGRRNGRGR